MARYLSLRGHIETGLGLVSLSGEAAKGVHDLKRESVLGLELLDLLLILPDLLLALLPQPLLLFLPGLFLGSLLLSLPVPNHPILLLLLYRCIRIGLQGSRSLRGLFGFTQFLS